MRMDNTTFLRNKVTALSPNLGDGGAYYGGDSLNLTNCLFQENTYVFSIALVPRSAAVSCQLHRPRNRHTRNISLSLARPRRTNSADHNGGAIFQKIENPDYRVAGLDCQACVFKNNVAGERGAAGSRGGAVWSYTSGVQVFRNSYFDGVCILRELLL